VVAFSAKPEGDPIRANRTRRMPPALNA